MRNDQLVRVLVLMQTLRRRRSTLDELAGQLCVTTRTVRRDIEALADAGLPVCKSGESDDDVKRKWWLVR